MKLNEILDKSVPYEVINSDRRKFKTKAKIGDREIIFTAHIGESDTAQDEWLLSFEEVDKHGAFSYDKTGSGNELEVFAMVKDSIIDFIERYDPNAFQFSAAKRRDGKNNRSRVYSKLINKFKLPGYKLNKEDGINSDYFFFEKE